MSTDLRVSAYQRQLTPVAIYLSKPDVIRNQIANSPPPRCQPLLRAIRPRYRVRVQADVRRRPTPSILSAEHARFPATNLFLKELLNLKSTPFDGISVWKSNRDRDWKCHLLPLISHTIRADSNRPIFRGCNLERNFVRAKRERERDSSMESWHRETSLPVCTRILELSPRLPRQMHPLAALNSTAYAPSWSARPYRASFHPSNTPSQPISFTRLLRDRLAEAKGFGFLRLFISIEPLRDPQIRGITRVNRSSIRITSWNLS